MTFRIMFELKNKSTTQIELPITNFHCDLNAKASRRYNVSLSLDGAGYMPKQGLSGDSSNSTKNTNSSSSSSSSSSTNARNNKNTSAFIGCISGDFKNHDKRSITKATVSGNIDIQTNSNFSTLNRDSSHTEVQTKDSKHHWGAFIPVGDYTQAADTIKKAFSSSNATPPPAVPPIIPTPTPAPTKLEATNNSDNNEASNQGTENSPATNNTENKSIYTKYSKNEVPAENESVHIKDEPPADSKQATEKLGPRREFEQDIQPKPQNAAEQAFGTRDNTSLWLADRFLAVRKDAVDISTSKDEEYSDASTSERNWAPVLFPTESKGVQTRITQNRQGRTQYRDVDTGQFSRSPLKRTHEQRPTDRAELLSNINPVANVYVPLAELHQKTVLYEFVPRYEMGNETVSGSIGITGFASALGEHAIYKYKNGTSIYASGQAAVGVNLGSVSINTTHVQSQTDVNVLTAKVDGEASFDVSSNEKVNIHLHGMGEVELIDLSTTTQITIPCTNINCDVNASAGIGLLVSAGIGYSSYQTISDGSAYASLYVKPAIQWKGEAHCYLAAESLKLKGGK